MIDLNNILDNLKDKLNELKLKLLNVKNSLDKISNIPTSIVILETDLTKLDFNSLNLDLIEDPLEANSDLINLKYLQDVYHFLIDPDIENDGVKKECLDTLNNIIKKIKTGYSETKSNLDKEKEELEELITKSTKLKDYLEKITTNDFSLSYSETEELLELINILELDNKTLFNLICYLTKLSLRKSECLTPVISKDNIDTLITESNENQERILNNLEENDDIYQEKVLKILDLIEETKKVLEEYPVNYYLSLKKNLKHYIDVNDFESFSIVMPTITKKEFLTMHYLINPIINLKECLSLEYDKYTIDDIIKFYETYLEEFSIAKELLEDELLELEDDEELDFDETDDLEEDLITDISDFPTFLSSSKNILLLNKTLELTSFQIDLDLKNEDISKQAEKQKGFIKTLNMFVNQTYEGGSGIKAKFSREGTKKIDKLYKDKTRKKYDKELSPYRLRTIDKIRTGYLIIPICPENRKKIFDLYGNEDILKDGTVTLLFSIIWTDASHHEYTKLNKNLYSNVSYIRRLKEIFNDPNTKKEELKEIIDESMARCFDTLKTLKKEETYVS